MLIGVSEELFWTLNPRKLAPYTMAHEKRQFEIDRLFHLMGAYVYDATCAAVSGFGKRAHKYRSKPFLKEEEERLKIERMNKKEKLEKVEEIFDMLDKSVVR